MFFTVIFSGTYYRVRKMFTDAYSMFIVERVLLYACEYGRSFVHVAEVDVPAIPEADLLAVCEFMVSEVDPRRWLPESGSF